MDARAQPLPGVYGILIEPLKGCVTLHRDGVLLAESRRAKVMYETRLPPTVYFPAEDVRVALSAPTDLQTFCPFKGTAGYRDILLPDERLENGVWSYEDALPESAGISGHVGFMPGTYTDFDPGPNRVEMPDYGNISGPVIDWLLREAVLLATPEDFTAALAGKFVQQGVPLSRMSVMVWSLHPLVAGKNFIWNSKEGVVTTYAPSYEIHDHPAYRASPLRHVSQGLGGVRHRIAQGRQDDDAFPILEDLRKDGATDYVAMPLRFSDGRINVLTLSSTHPAGFSTSDLGLVFECAGVIARYYEVFMQRENAQSLLETYVGKRTGARVLGGEIRRGDGDEIDAAIMFCDLRGSTRLEEELGRRDYIELLNQFFETASTLVHDNGGEVLKFIGDAVLAVFPAGSDPDQARAQALDSARAIVNRLEALAEEEEAAGGETAGHRCECAIGIAYGRVTYGNVGSRERLDFTVIGQAANVAARLGDYGKSAGRPIVVSQDALGSLPEGEPLGAVQLHNVSRPVVCYAIAAAPLPQAAAE